ncbi:HAMP domain-containing histidine kinase [Fusibacter paucivorans]|uniref:histidine kinase n=1 Tax=Fusibacter paucivorans TaxID=76009 RepID=A0ABS5PK66_9FIRM|nr:HAMP domain-containing sensor histidine kinase [Fusibacter paucivorans]MBS7525550.1 HAMP domain-containing histidine kinase [Fusibacter paucivorans]
MTLRKQWLVGMLLMAVLTVILNTIILNVLTRNVFDDYISTAYETHVNQLTNYCERILSQADYDANQLVMELEAHLTDPITQIKLYTPDGELLATASTPNAITVGFGGGNHMMQRMMSGGVQEVDQYEIKSDGDLIGVLNITRYSALEHAVATQNFRYLLIRNSLLVMVLVIALALILSARLSRRLTQSLHETVTLSEKLDLGEEVTVKYSRTQEIRRIQESLMGLHAKLKLKQKSRKQFIDEIVHQSRTPLTILKTHFEGFEDGVIEFNEDEIRICMRQIDEVTQLIENVGHLIETESDASTIHITRFSVPELIGQITRGLSLQFEKKGIKLRMEGHGDIQIASDIYKLSQTIYNLLTNAYKYTETGGDVHVEYALLEEVVTICVSDTGIGIDESDQDHIFEAYYRGSTAQKTTGEGIGLFIASENIKLLGGTITVRSKRKEGTTFIIKLPYVPEL